jgi:hypothetical protein
MDRLKFKQQLVPDSIGNNTQIMFKNNKKSGSAILLVLMIMSAILSATLYINVLSIRSIKQSKSIDNSMVAFYAAEMGNEQAIYYIRKVEDLKIKDLQLPGGVIYASKDLVSRVITDEVKNVLIGLEKDDIYQLDLFDQSNLSLSSSISYLELDWEDNCGSDSRIELTANEWEAQENINWGQMQNQMHISKCLLDNSSVRIDDSGDICSDIILDKNNSYQFRFKALSCDVYNLSIKAFDENSKQIAFKNIYSIESVGEYPPNSSQSNKQALRVNLRKFSPLSGLFDYVLFSEKDLVKDIGAYTGGWFSGDLFITTDNLPSIRAEEMYSFTLRAANGAPPYEWSLSGSIPPELEIDNLTGILSGKIKEAGVYPLIVGVKDRANPVASDSKTLFLEVTK